MCIGRTFTLLAVLLTLGPRSRLGAEKAGRGWAGQARPAETPLAEVGEKHFEHWDRNHNGALDLAEVDHLIEDHSIHGRQAALRRLPAAPFDGGKDDKSSPHKLTHKELLKLVEERDFQQRVTRNAKHLETIDRELFLPTDPDPATFGQGRLNDCYLLSTIAAEAHRSPKTIREMIHPQVTGGFQVVYGDGQKIQVAALTDAELLFSAKLDHRHGSWLAVLEKSYGIIRKREKNRHADAAAREANTVPFETLNFGDTGVIISLMTGRHADSLQLAKAHPDQVHNLLVETTKKRRLICCGKNKDPGPPGIVSGHAYAILGYDAGHRLVTVFNPWGNNFTPKGTPGPAHGFVTKNGQFTLPLVEFKQVFSDIVYESDRPLKK